MTHHILTRYVQDPANGTFSVLDTDGDLWPSQSHGLIRIVDMSDAHLANAEAMVRRNGQNHLGLTREIQRRELFARQQTDPKTITELSDRVSTLAANLRTLEEALAKLTQIIVSPTRPVAHRKAKRRTRK